MFSARLKSVLAIACALFASASAQAQQPYPTPYMAPTMPMYSAPLLPAFPQLPTFSLPQLAAPGTNPLAGLATNPWLQNLPVNALLMMQVPHEKPTQPYGMRRIISQEEKRQMMQMALPMVTGLMNMGMPDAINYYALKYKAKPGLSFDDVRDSLFLRANQVNMKKVGENLMWKDFEAVLEDKTAPRIEVYSFCDIAVGRELLKISPEFVIFLPCRIAIMEDDKKDIWVMMLDWNPEWVAGYKDKLGLSDELWKGAVDIHKRLDNMMQAAANGDL